MDQPTVKSNKTANFVGMFLASYMLLAASLTNYLLYDRYPLLRVDTALAYLILAVVAALIAGLFAAFNIWFQKLLFALLIALVVDINTDGSIWPIAAAAIFLVLTVRAKEVPHQLFVIFGGFFLVSSLIGLGQSKAWLTETKPAKNATAAQTNRPAIIHVLLDEHIGIEGFHKSASGNQTAAKLRSFYTANDFALYGKAYSRHMHTVNAVPHILNFGEKSAQDANRQGATIGKSAYFDALTAMDYRLSIYQSDFADFCSGYESARCVTYSNSSLQPLLDYKLDPLDRTTLILAKFFGLSQGLDYVVRQFPFVDRWAARIGMRGLNGFIRLKETGTIPALKMLDKLAQDVETAQPGQAYFIHALFPHYPYTTKADCSPKTMSQWKRRKDRISMIERTDAYDEQAQCAATKVQALVAALKRSPVADNFVMIVHGDHGSRITNLDPIYERKAEIQHPDLVASFSTLFAVRLPGVKGSYSGSMVNADHLLKALTESQFRETPTALTNSQPYIFIDDRDWKPREKVPMPSNW
jgi:hypothetical protein